MSESKKKSRRQFLRNTTLAALAGAVLPQTGAASPAAEAELIDCGPTTLDFYGQGPFYTPNAPDLPEDYQLAGPEEPGTRLIISGLIRNLDCTQVIPNAEIDIWHANDAGQYDNQGYNLRGKVYSNSQGFYIFETIFPGKYLNGSSFRPRHIHVKVKPPGFAELTTQVYFEGDTDIPGDAAASIESGQYDATERIIPLTTNANDKLEGTWDIIVDGEGINRTHDLHLEHGMIYSVAPNPFVDRLTINYGVFRRSRIRLEVFAASGQMVAVLEEHELSAAKYEAVWSPGPQLPNGHYWIVLKVDDLQVHYLKIFKQS